MAVKIRLTRTGARNAACFRVVAADSRSPRDGRFIETLGWYDPRKTGKNFELKLDRIQYWQGVGAQCSHTVTSLVKRAEVEPEVEAAPAPVEDTPAPAEAAPAPVAADVSEAPTEADPADTDRAQAEA